MGRAKLHKLLYYAQGWHLTWMSEPLFRERIEAWTNGPVVADLWYDEKHARGRPPSSPLTSAQLATIDYVLDRYGRLSGNDLLRLTHEEDPWRAASEVDADGWGTSNEQITHEALRAYFERDEQYVSRASEVERLRQSGRYTFNRLEVTKDLELAIDRALAGERIHPSQLR